MLDDARLLDDGVELTVDICIVGSGAAGITLARELRDSGLSVLLLESGSFDPPDVTTASLYVGTMSGIDTWELDQMRYRGCGGTTNLWGGYCLPLQPEDFTARSYVPGGGWAIGYTDLAPFYPRACQTVEIGTFQYDPTVLSGRDGFPLLPFDPTVLETRVYRFSQTRFGTRYQADLSAATNVRWLLNGNLLAIRLTGPGGNVDHLDCGTIDGKRFTIQAGRYVLATGGIENARLLLASNLEQAEGVANSSGLVGTFLEHPHFYQAATILWDGAPPDLRFYTSHNAVDDDGTTPVVLMGAISLPAALRAQNQLTSFTGAIEPSTLPFGPNTPITPDVASSLLTTPSPTPQLSRLTLRTEQTFLDPARVTLGTDVDALGMPRPVLDWQIADKDWAAVQSSFAYIGREVGRLGLGRVNLPPLNDPSWVPEPGGHHMGTTRMSTDARYGVVDGNLRAHDVDNLYIAGSSTFASGGNSNPTLTIVALAHRLADYLKAGST